MKLVTITKIISILFVILFLYTGANKLMEYSVFKEQIAASPILEPFAPWIAWMLPMIEFIIAILLFIPRWRLQGLYSALGLMVMFTGYIIAILCLDDHLPCSCGGLIELLSWRAHLIFNSVFILLALIGIWLARKFHKASVLS